VTSFHPEYGYEDFIEGYRPATGANGSLTFKMERGVFRRLCDYAIGSPELDYYLIIDEINRGDVPRIFGELLTLLESDKRGEVVRLSASGDAFHVPPNVFLIGTMNTADRSIALLDVALRRRFGFVELMPDYSVLEQAVVGGLPLGPWLRYINGRIRAIGGTDARNRQIGHAFLLAGGTPITTVEQLTAVLRDDVIPLLEEYCYDDFEQVSEIIGSKLVDKPAQRIRRELLEADRGIDLIAALNHPEIVTGIRSVVTIDDAGDEDADEPDDVGPSNV
jgi:5-methylcytosine-specific restriction protein B